MFVKKLLLPALISLLAACTTTTTPKHSLIDASVKGDIRQFGGATRLKAAQYPKVKHIIFFLGDGTSDSEITIARNYVEGASGYFKGIDALPHTGSYTTYSINKDRTIDYVTDSAASASAWATGIKTYNGAIGVDLQQKPRESILALAKKAGYATGDVTTTEIQDATPAALVAHVSHRKCYSPSSTAKLCPNEALENNGLGSISEQLLDARPDVTLGGGYASFEETARAGKYKGQTLLAQAQDKGYQIVTDRQGLEGITQANQNKPVLGLFAQGNLPVRWTGPQAVQGGSEMAAQRCQNNPEMTASTPSLKMMTEKAISLLESNKKGFFLQVESGSIDKQNHLANPCGQIGETVAFDEAIQAGLAFAKTHPDTLIIVTGDHAHASQIIPTDSPSPGKTARLLTQDNSPMVVNYATSTGSSQEHTGSQVRTAAYGPGAEQVSGLLDQTDMFFIMKNALNIK